MPSSKRNTGKRGYTKEEREALAKAREILGPPKKRKPSQQARLDMEKRQRAERGRRGCLGTNLRGDPCGASPLRKGTEIEGVIASGDYCLNHDPDVPDGAFARFVQEKGVAKLKEKPRQRRPLELLGQAVIQAPGLILRPHLEALGLEWDPDTEKLVQVGEGAKIVGFSREGYARVSKHKDLEAQQRAAERLLDRVFGKPRQAVDVGAGGNGMVGIIIPQTAERARVVLDVLQESGAIQLPNGNGNGDHAEESITDADVVEEP